MLSLASNSLSVHVVNLNWKNLFPLLVFNAKLVALWSVDVSNLFLSKGFPKFLYDPTMAKKSIHQY